MKDAIAGTMLVLAMLAFFAIGVAWVALWDSTWQAAVEPTRAQIYKARIGPQTALRLWHGGGSGKRGVG